MAGQVGTGRGRSSSERNRQDARAPCALPGTPAPRIHTQHTNIKRNLPTFCARNVLSLCMLSRHGPMLCLRDAVVPSVGSRCVSGGCVVPSVGIGTEPWRCMQFGDTTTYPASPGSVLSVLLLRYQDAGVTAHGLASHTFQKASANVDPAFMPIYIYIYI